MRRFLRRKWLFRFALIGLVGAVAVPIATWLYVRESGRSRLAETIRHLNETEPGWTKDDLCTARNERLPPEDRNSFDLVRKAQAAFPANFTSFAPDFERIDHPSNSLLRPEDLALAEKHFATAKPALEIARKLADAQEGGRVMMLPEMPIEADLTEIQNARSVIWAMQWDARIAVQTGRPADAVRSVRAVLGTARAIGDEPVAISQLVRTACAAIACQSAERTLALSEPTDGLAELQAELLREADFPRLTHKFRGERASLHQLFLLIDSGDIDKYGGIAGLGMGSPDLLDRLMSIGRQVYIPDDHNFSLKMMTGCIEASRRPFDEQLAAFQAVPQPVDGDRRHFITSLFGSMNYRFVAIGLRIRGQLLATAAGIACERYRQRTGQWPASLEAIPKDILPAVPNDPFTGKPLTFRKLPDGITIYSIGEDGQDDGGRFQEASATPSEPKTRDHGIRLWDKDQRRQPPPPKPDPVKTLEDADSE